jgi:sulfoxide reductase catalytic subunit YedY
MGRQAIQSTSNAINSLHLVRLFLGFIVTHGTIVFVTGLRQNTNHMFGSVNDASWTGFSLFVVAMVILAGTWLAASPLTIRYARLVQHAGAFMVGWIMGFAER